MKIIIFRSSFGYKTYVKIISKLYNKSIDPRLSPNIKKTKTQIHKNHLLQSIYFK